MNAGDDLDREEKAKWAEIMEGFSAFLDTIKASHCLDVRDRKLPPGTKLLVTCITEGRQDVLVEFTMLDPASCKVLVKDGGNFKEPTEGKLLGTEYPEAEQPGAARTSEVIRIRRPRTLLEGQLKRMGLLVYEVAGKKFSADGIGRVQVFLPGWTKPYDLWFD
jgi:hypothetical protein